MRRFVALLVALGFWVAPIAAGGEECRYVRVERPGGPPIEVRVCPD